MRLTLKLTGVCTYLWSISEYFFVKINLLNSENQNTPTYASTRLGPLSPERLTQVNHRLFWVVRDLKDHLVQIPLPWVGTQFSQYKQEWSIWQILYTCNVQTKKNIVTPLLLFQCQHYLCNYLKNLMLLLWKFVLHCKAHFGQSCFSCLSKPFRKS